MGEREGGVGQTNLHKFIGKFLRENIDLQKGKNGDKTQRNTLIESSIKVHTGVQTMYVCIEVTIQQLFTALGGGNGTLW